MKKVRILLPMVIVISVIVGMSLPRPMSKADTCITLPDGSGNCGTTSGEHYEVSPTVPTVAQDTPTPAPVVNIVTATPTLAPQPVQSATANTQPSSTTSPCH